MDPLPKGDGRVVPAKSNFPPKPGHADTLKPSQRRVEDDAENRKDITVDGEKVESQAEMLRQDAPPQEKMGDEVNSGEMEHSRRPSEKDVKEDAADYDIDFWEPKPPKVLMEDSETVPLELRAQIQLYATTE